MIRILTTNGQVHCVELTTKLNPLVAHRMVAETRGTITMIHKRGILSLRARDVKQVDFEDETVGAPWEYGEDEII